MDTMNDEQLRMLTLEVLAADYKQRLEESLEDFVHMAGRAESAEVERDQQREDIRRLVGALREWHQPHPASCALCVLLAEMKVTPPDPRRSICHIAAFWKRKLGVK